MKLTADEVDDAIDERTLREQHPELVRWIRHAEAPTNTAPRIPRIRKSGPVVIPTRPGWLSSLWAWMRGWV
jgi:hypothetical protein